MADLRDEERALKYSLAEEIEKFLLWRIAPIATAITIGVGIIGWSFKGRLDSLDALTAKATQNIDQIQSNATRIESDITDQFKKLSADLERKSNAIDSQFQQYSDTLARQKELSEKIINDFTKKSHDILNANNDTDTQATELKNTLDKTQLSLRNSGFSTFIHYRRALPASVALAPVVWKALHDASFDAPGYEDNSNEELSGPFVQYFREPGKTDDDLAKSRDVAIYIRDTLNKIIVDQKINLPQFKLREPTNIGGRANYIGVWL